MHDFDLNIQNLSKIEGHATLEIKVRNDKVEKVKLIVEENRRFFEEGVLGKNYKIIPQFVSRICGTCSVAHLTCASEAIEKALKVDISRQTLIMRKLALMGMILRDHAMHLYFFILPDILGKESVLDFDKKEYHYLREGFEMKAAGNKLTKLVGGRAIHPMFAQVGHFSRVPDSSKVKETLEILKAAREKCFDIMDIMESYESRFKRNTNYVALADDNYTFLTGRVFDGKGWNVPEEEIGKYLKEVVIPYSQGTGYEFKNKEFLAGAIARMNINRNSLHTDTRKDINKYLRIFPTHDIYRNNLAQAIENLHCIDSSIEMLESEEFKEEKKPEIIVSESEGVGVVEAPRGLLYNRFKLDKNGLIKESKIVTPTAQNQIRMENDIRQLVEENLDKSKEQIRILVEELIRSYDPCMTCASRFLKLKWI